MSRLTQLGSVLLAIALVSACTSGSATTTTDAAPGSTIIDPEPTTTATTAPSTGSTVGPSRPDLSGLEGLSVGVREQLEDLIVAAQEIRELPMLAVPTITVLDQAAFQERVIALLEETSGDVPADQSLYRLMGLLGDDDDLEQMFTELYAEAVAGFYDDGEIVVPAREEGLTIVQQGTLLHEMVHALTDQHFGSDEIRQQLVDEQRYDELNAYRGLAEGDATLAEVMWIRTLSQREIGEFIAESLDVDTTVLDSMPRFIRDSLAFPYDSGVAFAETLHGQGGWEAVNDAYVDMPELPGSTEQIITAADYGRDLPMPVDILDVEVPGYDRTVTSVWGELSLRLMLDQGLGDAPAMPAADGWGGDFYHQWFDGQNAALLLVYAGDTAADVEELRQGLLAYSQAMIDEEDFSWVDEEGGLLYFILADEVTVGESIRDAAGLTEG